jgi:DNA polymerase-3 subunit delta
VFYILHGEDEFSRSEALEKIKTRLGDPAMVSLNTTRLDGRDITMAELRHACDTIPFMTKRRLVIVENLLNRLRRAGKPSSGDRSSSGSGEGFAQALLEYLPNLPESTSLVFLESESLNPKNAFITLATRSKDKGYVREYPALAGDRLIAWVERRVRQKGARIEPEAASELATYVASGLRGMDQELEKLATYVGADGTITLKDVLLLVSPTRQASIFHMVDSLGERRARRALELLHRLLDYREPPLRILSMITRQFRMLMQWRQLRDEGHSGQEVQEIAGIRPRFVADKVARQARNFSLPQLKAVYRRLIEVDQQIKTGRMDAVLALDLLVIEVSLRRNLTES